MNTKAICFLAAAATMLSAGILACATVPIANQILSTLDLGRDATIHLAVLIPGVSALLLLWPCHIAATRIVTRILKRTKNTSSED